MELGSDIAVDLAGNAYVTGQTSSGNFPTLNAQQVSLGNIYDGGLSDAFVEASPTGGLVIQPTSAEIAMTVAAASRLTRRATPT
jgi:hypothetical protein